MFYTYYTWNLSRSLNCHWWEAEKVQDVFWCLPPACYPLSPLQLHVTVSKTSVKVVLDCAAVEEKSVTAAGNISTNGVEILGRMVRSRGRRDSSAPVSIHFCLGHCLNALWMKADYPPGWSGFPLVTDVCWLTFRQTAGLHQNNSTWNKHRWFSQSVIFCSLLGSRGWFILFLFFGNLDMCD